MVLRHIEARNGMYRCSLLHSRYQGRQATLLSQRRLMQVTQRVPFPSLWNHESLVVFYRLSEVYDRLVHLYLAVSLRKIT